eukprot:10605485-Alexandrium_andersonii.AAC.1
MQNPSRLPEAPLRHPCCSGISHTHADGVTLSVSRCCAVAIPNRPHQSASVHVVLCATADVLRQGCVHRHSVPPS